MAASQEVKQAARPASTVTHGDSSPAASVSGDLTDSTFHVGDVHHHYNQEPRSDEQAKPSPQVIESQIREIAKVEEFITRKDEWSLRVTFDFPDLLKYNMLQIKHSLDKET